MKIQNLSLNQAALGTYTKINQISSQNNKLNGFMSNPSNVVFGASYPSNYYLDATAQTAQDKESLDNYLKQSGKVKLTDYQAIASFNPRIIDIAQSDIERNCEMTATPADIAKCAYSINKQLKDTYGDNYVVVSIGVNPSFIAETMQALGSEVVYLPILGLKNEYLEKADFDSPEPLDKSIKKNTEILMEYLSKKGINEDINPDKKVILLDYSVSGESFNNLHKAICGMNNVPYDSVMKFSMVKMLSNLAFDSKFPVVSDNVSHLEEDITTFKIGKYSNCPCFNINNYVNQCIDGYIDSEGKTSEEIFKEFEDFNTYLGREFALCSIAEAFKLKNELENK